MEALFIHQAKDAFNSTNRDYYPLFGNPVSNLDATAFYLRQAHSLASPTRQTDLTISLANIETFNGHIRTALQLFLHVLQTANHDQTIDILCYLVVWHHALGDSVLSQTYLSQLEALSNQTALRISQLLDIIETRLSQPIHYLPQHHKALSLVQPSHGIKPTHAIVTMGYKLNADGSMAHALIQRLMLTCTLARCFSNSLIIVTGGVATAGHTEAQVMKQWLVRHGIKAERIIEENQAMNTIENVSYSLAIIHQKSIRAITLVSASIHVHRSHILFDSMQRKYQRDPFLIDHVAVQDELTTQPLPCGQTRINCYIDALRGFGLPAFRCGHTIQD